jgi:monofunctional biosynthetic peptidoglycan transglycosylase
MGAFLKWYWRGDEEGRTPWVRRTLAVILFYTVVLPVCLIIIFRFLPVPFTPQMVIDAFTGQEVHYSWRGWHAINPALGRAVIAAEDQNFCRHNGFDWKAIEKALKNNERGRKVRGGSTISQQTARTVFMTPVRNWARKGIEAYLTVLIEFFWPKERILLVYLNLVDWGHGNYGAEAAAQAYFGTSAGDMSSAQAARLAAILPSPDKWRADRPGRYVARRATKLVGRSSYVRRDGLDFCVRD